MLVCTRSEDPSIAIRYLENAVNHPDDPKYRRIKKANRYDILLYVGEAFMIE